MVLELLPRSLASVIFFQAGEKMMTPKAKDKIALQIADGMMYLHTTRPQIIHGDLKPANIMLTERLDCKIIDFGLATTKASSMARSNVAGVKAGNATLAYQAPELLVESANRNHKVDGTFSCFMFLSFIAFLFTQQLQFTHMR